MTDWGFANFDDEDEEEEDSDRAKDPWGQRDGLILLIDCTKQMFDVEEDDDDEEEENLSYFETCIKCAKAMLKNKIVSSDKDLVGIVFFGTDKSNCDFSHIYVYQDLDQPGAERIIQLEKLVEDGVQTITPEYGHSNDYRLSEALWTCSNMFSKSKQRITSKRIFLLTCCDDPHHGNVQLQRQARTKASDLNENGIELEVMALDKSEQNFDMTKFYKDLLFTADDEATNPVNSSIRLQDLQERVRSKEHKKRAQSRVSFSLGEGLNFSVGVYNLVRTCPKPQPVKLSKKSNEELKSITKTYLTDTAEVLMPQDLKMSQTYGGKKICFEKDEVNDIKRFDDPGLVLMGFKNRSCLKRHFHVKPAQFIYPDESTISGSTTMFSALLRKCLERDVVPLCRYIPRKNTPPRFVMLLPQDEEKDEQNLQTTPPGFHVIILPFADDFRQLPINVDAPRANSEQIEAAKAMVKRIGFPFDSSNFDNPTLQQHWRNIEALALDRDAPEEMDDYTLPDDKQMSKRVGREVAAFKDLVFPEDYVPGAKKRAGGGGGAGGAAKRPKTDTPLDIDIQKEANEGKLGKLTVAILKEFVKRENIKAGTKKADLIDAINAHFGL